MFYWENEELEAKWEKTLDCGICGEMKPYVVKTILRENLNVGHESR